MIFTLNAEPRHTVRKSDLNTLRAEGKIPAVIYGPKMESLPISLNKGEFMQLYKKSFAEVSFWEIESQGKKFYTILKDKQMHPVSRNVLHLDFMVVEKSSVIELDVPINYVGEAIGVKEGGILDILYRNITLSCKADAVPKELILDISDLNVNGTMHVKDLPKGDWTFKDHDDVALVVIHPKKQEEAPAAEPATAEATEEK